MALGPETPIEQEQKQRRAQRSRRGCSFYIGLFLLLGVVVLAGLALFGQYLLGGEVFPIGDAIGVVRVESMIVSADAIVEELRRYADSSRILGILLRIESPGGAVGAAQEIYGAVREAQKKKPVFASMGNTAASGGYYVAAGAERIFANPGTVTGSIGVIFELTNWEDLVEKVGLRFEVVKSGEYKDIGSPARPVTAAERRILQGLIDDVYDQFLDAILETRRAPLTSALQHALVKNRSVLGDDMPSTMTLEQFARQIADGRLFSGRQAVELGLVDELGPMELAVQRLAEKVGLPPRPKLVETRRAPTLFDFLFGRAKAGLLPVGGKTGRLMYRMPLE